MEKEEGFPRFRLTKYTTIRGQLECSNSDPFLYPVVVVVFFSHFMNKLT